MPQELRVSVALCTHEGAAYIERQIASILHQSRLPDEIVLSDDASSDETVPRAERALAAAAPGTIDVVVLRNPVALGVTANFEQAIAATTGDIILLSDQDDAWRADRVSTSLGAMTADPGLLVFGSNAELIDAEDRPLGRSLFGDLQIRRSDLTALATHPFEQLIRRNLFTGATMAVRRSLIETARPFPTEWVHDEWLAILGAALTAVELSPEKLIDYRQHGANAIGVEAPSMRGKMARLSGSRAARNSALRVRAAVLVERLSALDVAPSVRASAAGKARFEQFRSQLPSSRVRRLPGVLRGLFRRDYSRYASQRSLDVVRDLVQSA